MTFEEYLEPLNPSQRDAASTTEGNLFISAGAGTGKTGTLTAHYVAALLAMTPEDQQERGVQGILAITYTKAAAAELNNRIRLALRKIGRNDLARQMGDAWISTFHAFCLRLLKTEAPVLVGDLSLDPQFEPLDELESAAMLSQAYAETFDAWAVNRGDDLRKLYAAATRSDVEQSIADVLSCCNTYGYRVDDVRTHSELEHADEASHDSPEGNRPWRVRADHVSRCVVDLARDVQGRYEEMKAERGALDFHDLILRAHRVLTTNPEVADRYRAQFDRIIIDEFQDTNELQYQTFRAISRNNVSVVGDKNQSIYAFQGAEAAVFDRARTDLFEATADGGSVAKRAELGTNYRSHQDVLSFVNRAFSAEAMFGAGGLVELVSHEDAERGGLPAALPSRLVIAPIAARHSKWPTCPGDVEKAQKAREARWVADWVERLVDGGDRSFSLADIRILTRTRSRATTYAEELLKRGIPAVVDGGEGLLADPAVTATIALLRLMDNQDDDEAFVRLMVSPIGRVSDQDLADVHFATRLNPSGAATKATLWATAAARVAEGLASHDLADTVRSVDMAARAQGILPLDAILRAAIAQRGYDLALLAPSSDDVGEVLRSQQSYDNLMAFIAMAGEWDATGGSLREFLADIDRKIVSRKTLKLPQPTVAGSGRDVVTIQTIHASKGLEFPVVIFPVARWSLDDMNSGCSRVDRLNRTVGEPGTALPIVVATRVALTPEELATASGDAAAAVGMAEPLLSSNTSSKVHYEPAAWRELEAQRFERETAEAKRLMYVAASRAKQAVIMSHSAADFSKSESRLSGAQIWQSMLEEQFLEGTYPQYRLREDLPFDVTLELDYLIDSQLPEPEWAEAVAAFARAEQRKAACADDAAASSADKGCAEGGAAGGGGAASDAVVGVPGGGTQDGRPSTGREVEYQVATVSAEESLTQVSASHIGAYYSCPRQYHLQYRAGAGSLRTRDPDDATNLGNALHAILERGWASPELDEERALSIVRAHRISEPKHQEVRRQAQALLASRSMGDVRADDYSVRTEHQFYVPLGDCSSLSLRDGGGVFLQGYIDLLAMRSDGTARVLDYKSGHGRKREAYETQARCYAAVALLAGATSAEIRFLMPDAETPPPGAELDGSVPFHRFTYVESDVADIEAEILDAVRGMAGAASVNDEALKELVEYQTCQHCGYGGPLCKVGASRKRR